MNVELLSNQLLYDIINEMISSVVELGKVVVAAGEHSAFRFDLEFQDSLSVTLAVAVVVSFARKSDVSNSFEWHNGHS